MIPLVVMLIGFPVVGALGLWVGQPLIAPVGLLTVACVLGGYWPVAACDIVVPGV